MSQKILVSIINWNNNEATNGLLASIGRLAKSAQPDVVVIDNNSRSQPLKINPAAKKDLRSLRIVYNPTNVGFGAGHNQNIKKARAEAYDYIFVLNHDTKIIDKKLFSELVRVIEKAPKAIAANPIILSQQDPDIVWYGGGKMSLITSLVMHLGVGQASTSQSTSQEVGFLTGCCLAINLKRASLDQTLFKDDYFLYWEDADWCARAQRSGYKLLYVPSTKILHHVSVSLGVRSPDYIYYNIRNHYLFIRKNIKPLYWPLAWIIVGIIIAKYKFNIFFRYKSGRWPAIKALLGGVRDGWLGRTGPAGFSHE